MPRWYVFHDGRQRLCFQGITLVVTPAGSRFRWQAIRGGAPFAQGWAGYSWAAKQAAEAAGGIQSDETE